MRAPPVQCAPRRMSPRKAVRGHAAGCSRAFSRQDGLAAGCPPPHHSRRVQLTESDPHARTPPGDPGGPRPGVPYDQHRPMHPSPVGATGLRAAPIAGIARGRRHWHPHRHSQTGNALVPNRQRLCSTGLWVRVTARVVPGRLELGVGGCGGTAVLGWTETPNDAQLRVWSTSGWGAPFRERRVRERTPSTHASRSFKRRLPGEAPGLAVFPHKPVEHSHRQITRSLP